MVTAPTITYPRKIELPQGTQSSKVKEESSYYKLEWIEIKISIFGKRAGFKVNENV